MKNSIFNILKHTFNPQKKSNMEKEIYEQPTVISNLIKNYIKKDGKINIELPANISRVVLIASGSSFHSAAVISYYLRNTVHCMAQEYYASEFSLCENHDIDPNTLYVFISQSGETKDTCKSLEIVKAKTDKTLSITNTKNSTLYNQTKYKVFLNAGPENTIASTKSLMAQIFSLYLVAAKIMQEKQINSESLVAELREIPTIVKKVLNEKENAAIFSKKLSQYDGAAVIASGMFFPIAKEGALKIKETSYINTSSYPTGEFLHGHIAILNNKCAAITIFNNNNVDFNKKVLDKMNEDYNTDILVLSAYKLNPANPKNTNISLDIYKDIEFLFGSLTFLQLLALSNAIYLGRDVDSPNGLTKIVKI